MRLSTARRMISDYMWAANGIARVDVTRPVALGAVMAARRAMRAAPSVTTIFVKAFAIVAADMPELRRAYLSWPWPHFYEYTESTAVVAQEREIDGDLGLLPLRFSRPDAVPLGELDRMIRNAIEMPIEQSKLFRRVVALGCLPLLLRRLIWIAILNIPRLRRYVLGTYGVSALGKSQAELGTTRTPVPCLLSYGIMDEHGNVRARLNFDHRTFDGAFAGCVLARLEDVVNGAVLEELRALAEAEKSVAEAG